MSVNEILKERGSRYGDFDTFADISQQLKDIVYLNLSLDANEEKNNINNIISEGLDMIMHKIARILNGDPYYLDSWRDLSAYAKLVCNELEQTDGTTDVKTKQIVRKNGRWVHEVNLEQILDKVDNVTNGREPKRWQDKCLDCKYCHHILEQEEDIDIYVCEHTENLEESNIVHNGERIMKYKDIKEIWKDCKYKESFLK